MADVKMLQGTNINVATDNAVDEAKDAGMHIVAWKDIKTRDKFYEKFVVMAGKYACRLIHTFESPLGGIVVDVTTLSRVAVEILCSAMNDESTNEYGWAEEIMSEAV